MSERIGTIHEYIQHQVAGYKLPIPINDTWQWSMFDHIKTTVLYKNSQLLSGKDDFKPVKNITRPILNLQYRAEGFDVKDITLFVNNKENYYKSLIIKKYHEKYARENGLDTVIDDMVESYVDFGGALLKKGPKGPEVVPLQSIAFCDQTDILSGPICIKHYFSPDQLMDMEAYGWGDKKKGASTDLQTAIRLAREEKDDENNTQTTKTPGKYVEVYELHGTLPKRYLDGKDTSGTYVKQVFFGCFYNDVNNKKGYITLFHMPDTEERFKFIKRDPVHGRALGFGGAEELFEPQVWINYDMIRMQSMLDAASKTILKATGPNSSTIANKNRVRDMDNLQIIDVGMDSDLSQVDTFPRNLQLFEKSVAEWQAHAQQMGSANDSIMGENPSSGTPFKLQELVTAESHSLHEYRKGKLATFWDEIETDWIIPSIIREASQGIEFLAELDLDELQQVVESVSDKESNTYIREAILNGEIPEDEKIEEMRTQISDAFRKKGRKHFIKIFKKEFSDENVGVYTNVAGKQKQLAATVDRITNVFRFAFSNPAGFAQVMQIPGMADAFNQILEFSGLSPVDFAGIEKIAEQMQQQTSPQPQPLQNDDMMNQQYGPVTA
jgi:hypothetical protein